MARRSTRLSSRNSATPQVSSVAHVSRVRASLANKDIAGQESLPISRDAYCARSSHRTG